VYYSIAISLLHANLLITNLLSYLPIVTAQMLSVGRVTDKPTVVTRNLYSPITR